MVELFNIMGLICSSNDSHCCLGISREVPLRWWGVIFCSIEVVPVIPNYVKHATTYIESGIQYFCVYPALTEVGRFILTVKSVPMEVMLRL